MIRSGGFMYDEESKQWTDAHGHILKTVSECQCPYTIDPEGHVTSFLGMALVAGQPSICVRCGQGAIGGLPLRPVSPCTMCGARFDHRSVCAAPHEDDEAPGGQIQDGPGLHGQAQVRFIPGEEESP